MMLIQLVLIIAFILMTMRLLSKPGSGRVQAWKKLLALSFILLAIVVILFPDLATDFAHLVGVGRGADLLLYALTAAAVFGGLNAYITNRKSRHEIVVLARRLAILEARERQLEPTERQSKL